MKTGYWAHHSLSPGNHLPISLNANRADAFSWEAAKHLTCAFFHRLANKARGILYPGFLRNLPDRDENGGVGDNQDGNDHFAASR